MSFIEILIHEMDLSFATHHFYLWYIFFLVVICMIRCCDVGRISLSLSLSLSLSVCVVCGVCMCFCRSIRQPNGPMVSASEFVRDYANGEAFSHRFAFQQCLLCIFC